MRTTTILRTSVFAIAILSCLTIFSFGTVIKSWINVQFQTFKEVEYREEPPVALSCQNGVRVSLAQNGEGVVIPGMFIVSTYPNFADLTIEVVGRPEPIVNCNDIGQILMVRIHDPIANQTCMTSFQVEDKLPPLFNCQNDTVSCGIDPYTTGPPYEGLIEVSDNCTENPTVTLLSHRDTIYTCPSEFTLRVTRTYQAIDAYGNSSICENTVYFKRPVLDEIDFPADTTFDCSHFTSDTAITGEPLFEDYPIRGVCNTWSSYNDQVISMGCTGRFKIKRTWVVYDECAGGQRTEIQNIMSIDTVAPVITCPNDVTISANSACAGIYTFPTFNATDNCSQTSITFTKKVDGVVVYGSNATLSLGEHTITVLANDGCNNTRECTYQVTVVDDISPSIICHDIIVSLTADGTATVCKDSLDFWNTDNCDLSLDTSIRKMNGTTFSDCVVYTCAELGSNNMLVYKVCDDAGNCSTCMVQVTVQDKVPPISNCPLPPVEVTCDLLANFDYSTFAPVFTENCGTYTVSITRDTNITCNEGYIDLTYTATDNLGNSSQCTRRLNVTNPYIFNESAIDWPEDLVLEGCGTNPLNPIAGVPVYTEPYCNTLMIGAQLVDSNYTDLGCKEYVKVWVVMDPCTNETARDTQYIIADSGNPPLFADVPADITVNSNATDCNGFVTLTVTPLSCSTPLTVTNSYNDGGANASDEYPPGTTVVVFTATDACGRTSSVDVSVTVIDNFPPRITCPPSITIDCDDYVPGNVAPPFIRDNCSSLGELDLDTLFDESRLNACGAGVLTVIYSVTDEANNTNSCTYTITINNTGSIDENDITWPEDYILMTNCDGSIHPDTIGSRPIIINPNSCSRYSVSFVDLEVDPRHPNACFAIERDWTVIDSCSLITGEPGSGVFTYTQFIEVIDGNPPVFGGYAQGDTITFFVDTSTCQGFVDLSGLSVTDCSFITVTNDANGIGSDNNSIDASGIFDEGFHNIHYTATDACGNVSTFDLVVHALDTVPPVWTCPEKIELILNQDGRDTFYASQILTVTSYIHDNCTAIEDLRFSFDSLDVDMDSFLVVCTPENQADLSWKLVPFYVWDESGNITVCYTSIGYIIDPTIDPDCTHMGLIVGDVSTNSKSPISQVEIHAIGNSEYMQKTDINGKYKLFDIETGQSLVTFGKKVDNPLNGVNTMDIIRMKQHILGKKDLPSVYNILAADVNRDERFNTADIVMTRKLILGKIDKFNSEDNWRFVDRNYPFTNKHNPFNQPAAFTSIIESIGSFVPQINWIGVKDGDVDNSAKTSGLVSEPEIRSNNKMNFEIVTSKTAEGEVVLSISSEELNLFDGFQFDLNFDQSALQFEGYDLGDVESFTDDNIGINRANEGRVSFSWDREEFVKNRNIVSFRFRMLQSGKAEELIQLNNDRIEAFAFKGDQKASIAFNVSGQWVAPKILQGSMSQNVPNPFNHSTAINIQLTKSTKGVFKVFDATGKLIYRHETEFMKGSNSVKLNADVLKSSGVYYYTFESDIFTDTKKMIFIL